MNLINLLGAVVVAFVVLWLVDLFAPIALAAILALIAFFVFLRGDVGGRLRL